MPCPKTFVIIDARCPFHVSLPNEMNSLKQPWSRKLSTHVITVKFGPRTVISYFQEAIKIKIISCTFTFNVVKLYTRTPQWAWSVSWDTIIIYVKCILFLLLHMEFVVLFLFQVYIKWYYSLGSIHTTYCRSLYRQFPLGGDGAAKNDWFQASIVKLNWLDFCLPVVLMFMLINFI